MDNDNFATCWNCGKENKRQACGYYFCDCKSYKESSLLWYLPLEVYYWRRGRMFSYNKEENEIS